MIIYFSGTGNSRYVAEALGHRLGDTVCSLHPYLRENIPLVLSSEQPYVLVAPIYAWRFPRRIESLLQNAELSGSDRLYCVGTMGANSGHCDTSCEALAQAKQMQFMGFQGVRMPNNYLPGGHIPDMTEAARIIENAVPAIDRIANTIRSGGQLKRDDFTLFGGLLSKFVNEGFTRFMTANQQFIATDACIGCGECASFCPVGNITLQKGKPQFGTQCMSCYGCVHRCKTAAICVGKHSAQGSQYVCVPYSLER